MPGTFSLIAGGCLLDSVPDLPDSSKFRPELMSQGRCWWCCRISAEFSGVILFSAPNGLVCAQEICVHKHARACVCCACICLL